jgi:hypothetical protein
MENIEKDINSKGECLNKSLISVLISLFQYIHYQIYSDFPHFNILDEVDFLVKNKDNIFATYFRNEKEFETLEKCTNLLHDLLKQVKIFSKSTSNIIFQIIYDLKKLVDDKYKILKKRPQEIIIDEDTAQRWFDDVLYRK